MQANTQKSVNINNFLIEKIKEENTILSDALKEKPNFNEIYNNLLQILTFQRIELDNLLKEESDHKRYIYNLKKSISNIKSDIPVNDNKFNSKINMNSSLNSSFYQRQYKSIPYSLYKHG